ncbi:putative methyltransferase [hydrocarbon metagenome]|uniref:Putative methyltransferase n=1 Tax=hydrocarbon metagenome TaxID=938273 RepID=A0A0W8FL56_9ZZZZ
MKSLQESVLAAMDGTDVAQIPFFHYILQDLWEIGTDPSAVIELVRKHKKNYSGLRILDLGCGKGAVSVNLVCAFGCSCLGIDAIPEFVDVAREKAVAFDVGHRCRFEAGDIRIRVKEISGFDVIVLGSIGPVFGDYYQTLTALSPCLPQDGIIVIDDGYIDNHSRFSHLLIQKRETILRQIDDSGMRLIDETIIDHQAIKDSDDYIFQKIEQRCRELIRRHPEKKPFLKTTSGSKSKKMMSWKTGLSVPSW